MRNTRFVNFLIILFLLLGQIGSADLFGKSNTTAELVLESRQVAPGGELRGAFRITMEENWHTYWRFAGDVGLATEATWDLPSGWVASELKWPIPTYLETSGLVSYAYEDQVLLPFVLTVSPDAIVGEEVALKVQLDWLECHESCIPADASLEQTVTIASESILGPDAEVITEAFDALPPFSESVQVSRQDNTLHFTLPQELNHPDVRFFPGSKGLILDSETQVVQTVGDQKVLSVQADPETVSSLEEIAGLLATGDIGVEFQSSIVRLATEPAETAGLITIILTAGAAFVGGLILNLMPCVFPVLSLKVLGIVEQSRSEGRPAWHHGVVFTAGVLISFWFMSGILLGVRAAGQEVGWGYHLQNSTMIAGLAILFLLIALNLFGVFEVGENLTRLSGVADKKEGFAGSFWSGVLTTVAATPCTAPFMGGAIGFALAQPAWVSLLIFSFLALGVAAPYMTLTLFPKLLQKLPRPGVWMVTFKQVLAFPMLLAVVWLTWVFGSQMGLDRMALLLIVQLGVAFACWSLGRWGTSFEPNWKRFGIGLATVTMVSSLYAGYVVAQPRLGDELWTEYSPELIEQLEAERKPYFLDFTADWCTSCKANELMTLSRRDVLDKFKELDITLVKADWTKKDPIITAALAKHGRAGVPLYVLHPGGEGTSVLLPEVLLPTTMLDALGALEP